MITALIFLVVLTILGLSSMSSITLEQRMAGNMRDATLSFQAAEAALRGGENWLAARTSEPVADAGASEGVWSLDSADPDASDARPWWQVRDAGWWGANAVPYNAALQSVVSVPRYVVEERAFVKDDLNIGGQSHTSGRLYYRITAYGNGATTTARTLLQSTYAKRF